MLTAPALMPAPLHALQQSEWVIWLKTSAYAYPTLEVLHLLGIATLFGTLLVVELRLLGALREFDASMLTRRVLPWTLAGFALAAASGLTLLLSRADELVSNPAFVLKMVLLFAVGCNAAVLHARGPLAPGQASTRAQVAISLLLWVSVIACGRWIAYV